MEEGRSYATHSIAAAYGLALAPHYYNVLRMMGNTRWRWSFAMPRTNMDVYKDKVPKSVWGQCYRARCAHVNALEGFPLFATAMLAGTVSGLPTKDLNASAAQYLGLRTLYTVLYIGVENSMLALARTSVWGLSIVVPCWTLWKAGLSGGKF